MDPLFSSGISTSVVVVVLIKTVVTFVFLLIATMAMVWFERKIVADMENRIGPNRAGPFGILQTLADGIKLFFK
ncbi:MAG: NADH-quinone oxidoreductase subunit, partial [Acidimicrobiaceae bacterium]